MITMSKPLKSVRVNNKFINNTVLKTFYSTASGNEKSNTSANNSNSFNSTNDPPQYPPGYDYKNYYGWGPYWNMKSSSEFYNYHRRYRRGGFGFFLFGFVGGILAHKFFTKGCSGERWEKDREMIENFYNDYYNNNSNNSNNQYSNKIWDTENLSQILNSLPIVQSLRSDPDIKECKILDNHVISPTTNSTFIDSVVLPVKPIEFINKSTSEQISVLTVPVFNERNQRRHFGWGRGRKHSHNEFNDNLVMLVDEYMKQNASKFLNIPKSKVFTQSLTVDFKSWFNNYNNIVLKICVDKEKSTELNSVFIKGLIMTTEGKVISQINGIFTNDATKAPKENKEVYSFRKLIWSD